MKKFLPIIIGVTLGTVVAATLISVEKNKIAYGQEGANWWNSFIATVDEASIDWQDVFTPLGPAEKGNNLYNLIYRKLTRDAGKDALLEVAKNNGLSTDDAKAILNGSLLPILNNPKYSKNITQDTAAKIMTDMQENFADLAELYQVQREVDTAIAPSEMFANGDLSDSGFDLVRDLTIIEEILFLERTPVSVGGDYENAADSPYKATDHDKTIANYVPNEVAAAYLPLVVDEAEGTETEESGGSAESNEAGNNLELAGSETGKIGVISLGDKKIEAEILAQDICAVDDALNNALEDYSGKDGGEEKKSKDGSNDSGIEDDEALSSDSGAEFGGAGSEAADGDNIGGGVDGKKDQVDNESKEEAKSKPAKADDWTKEWCAGLEEAGTFAGIGSSGFKSLGGVSDNFIDGGGAAAGFESKAVDVKMSVCFDVKTIKKQVSSYLPGDSCILCEVEKINEFIDKTLSHSLVPNKATGNLLESAKCKKAASLPLINLQFIVIWNPIPTPLNDKLIFGKNIFEEWNKFAERYQPALLEKINFDSDERPDLTDQFNLDLQAQIGEGNKTQSDLFDSIRRIKSEAAAKASLDVEEVKLGNELANEMVYSRNVLKEIKQMNALFKNFKDTYNRINKEALEKIINKPDID